MAKAETNEQVKPIILHDTEAGIDYTLEFNRETIRFAESRGFDMEDVGKYPMTKLTELFYYAFRMHHKNMARSQTDKLFERLGGYSPNFLERLVLLYNQALTANNVVETDEDMGKNGNLGVELE
jgi:hypothetical protein